jgi:hypothetical protein
LVLLAERYLFARPLTSEQLDEYLAEPELVRRLLLPDALLVLSVN